MLGSSSRRLFSRIRTSALHSTAQHSTAVPSPLPRSCREPDHWVLSVAIDLVSVGSAPAGVTELQAKLLFVDSSMAVTPPTPEHLREPTLRIHDFLEALARLSDAVWLPTPEDVKSGYRTEPIRKDPDSGFHLCDFVIHVRHYATASVSALCCAHHRRVRGCHSTDASLSMLLCPLPGPGPGPAQEGAPAVENIRHRAPKTRLAAHARDSVQALCVHDRGPVSLLGPRLVQHGGTGGPPARSAGDGVEVGGSDPGELPGQQVHAAFWRR